MKKRLTPPRSRIPKLERLVAAFSLVFVLIITALIARVVITSGNERTPAAAAVQARQPLPPPTPSATPSSNTPLQTSPTRISIVVGTTSDLPVATGVDSFVLVSPDIASCVAKNRFTLTITALKIGETMLIARYGTQRQTYVIEVVGKPRNAARATEFADSNGEPRKPPATTGSFSTTYTRGSGGGTSLVRQNVDLRTKLSNDRTLRVSGEMFKLFGGSTPETALARVQDFALNRTAVGVDTKDQNVDFLDSHVNISAMSLNSYTIRGFHLTKTPKRHADANFQKKGLEVYAGLARPSLAFFDTNGGKVAGALVPVLTSDKFQARAGFTAVAADNNSREVRGGVVAHADVIYAPTKEISIDSETSFAKGDLSWRTRMDVRYAKYGGSAEVTRFARSSPLNSIGAQSGGRQAESLSFYWRPVTRLNTSAGYNHTRVSRQTSSQLADYDRSLMFVNASYSLSKNSRVNLRFSDQKIDTAFRGGPTSFDMQTRTISAGHSVRFNQHFSNTFEARLNFNKEGRSGERLETGFSLREQLRFAWKGSSLTGFVNYTNKTPSLASLIVRNPQLLPPLLQTAFVLDPVQFLRVNRDRLAFLLGGVDLPLTRSLDAGLRLQKTFSRFTVSAETRYNAGEIYAVNQKNLSTSVSVGLQLDRANSLQISAWKSLGGNAQSGITAAYTHRFGASGDGFQFSKLFGFGRGRVRGRVFYDLNGNGVSDVGEPGLAGMKIEVDGKRKITTGSDGSYEFTGTRGTHRVVLMSAELGQRLLATTPTEQSADIGGLRKLDLNFGVRDHGSVRGRVINDVSRDLGVDAGNSPGLAGVRVLLRPAGPVSAGVVLERLTDASGSYDFSNLRPGKYVVVIDADTLPPNFRIPTITGSTLDVAALKTSYNDIPIAAQRAVAGVVYIDLDANGGYTPGTDLPVHGANVALGNASIVTDEAGRYLLRNLPAGLSHIFVRAPGVDRETTFRIELGAEPVTRRSTNIAMNR